MMTRKEREMLQRRQDIINAAKDLFQQKDYEAVTMQDIALKAEFTRRTLYSYFKSKLDLVTVIVLESFVEMEKILILEVSKKHKNYDKLFTYASQQFYFYLENPSYFKLIHYFDIAVHNPESKLSREVLEQLYSSSTSLDELINSIFETGISDGTFREDLNVQLVKDYFAKAWYGIIHQYILHPQHPQEFVFIELEYLIGGLLRK
jgi:AcrR family transcriptional regulator